MAGKRRLGNQKAKKGLKREKVTYEGGKGEKKTEQGTLIALYIRGAG